MSLGPDDPAVVPAPALREARAVLEDGSYDVFVVDLERADDGRVDVDVTILGGAHRGEVVSLRAPAPAVTDVTELLGVPGTLVVAGGRPSLTFEP